MAEAAKETKNVQQTEKGQAQVGAGAKTVKRKALRAFTQHIGGHAAAIQAQEGQDVEVPEDQVEALEEGGFIERQGGAKAAQPQAQADEDEQPAKKPAPGAKR